MIAYLSELAQLGWAQLWQVTVVALAALIIVRLFCRTRPHLAYVLLLVVVMKCLTPPILYSPTGIFSWKRPKGDMSAKWHGSQERFSGMEEQLALPAVGALGEGELGTPDMGAHRGVPNVDQSPLRLRGVAVLVWGCGVVAVGAYATLRWLGQLRAIRSSSRPACGDLADLLHNTSERLGIKRSVKWLVSSECYGPCCFGVLFPTIVLPEILVKHTARQKLVPIVAHELIHVRRGDCLVGLLQLIAGVVWWFHPLVWCVGRQLSRERERCCDEEVVANTGCDPEAYVRGMVDVLRSKQHMRPLFLASRMSSVDVTKERLEAIMRRRTQLHSRTPWFCWCLMVIGLVLVLPGAPKMLRPVLAASANEATNKNESGVNDQRASLAQSTAGGRELQVSDAEFERAASELRKLGGHVRISFQRTDPRHWVQIILEGDDFSDDAMSFVRLLALESSTLLHLTRTAVTKDGLAELRATKTKKLVLIGDKVDDACLVELPNLPFLENLNLADTNATDAGFEFIEKCRPLKSLALSGNVRIGGDSLACLKHLPELHRLSLGTPFADRAVRHVNQLAKIDDVTLTSENMTNTFLRDLKALPTIRRLGIAGNHVDDETLQLIGNRAKELESLKVRSNHISDAGLKHLSDLRDLEKLFFDGAPITDAGVENLRDLSRLQWLDLSDTNVGDGSLAIAGSMPRMRHLFLMNTNVTEAGLEHLKDLENLRSLQLQGTYVKNIPAWMNARKDLQCMVDSVPKDTLLSKVRSTHTSLAEAVESFNESVGKHPIGKFQSPLTVGEVVAAIRGWNRKEHPVDERTYEVFHSIAETQEMPKTASLEYTSSWSGENGYDFVVWWIDVKVMTSETMGYGFRIRDRKIASRATAGYRGSFTLPPPN